MPYYSRRTLALIVTMMLIIVVPTAANANDDPTDESKAIAVEGNWAPHLSFWFDHDQGILVFGPTDPSAEQPLDCTPTGDPLTVDEDGAVAGEIPAGCFGIVIDGTQDSISHGDVVSQTVRALKELRDELDGPFGRYGEGHRQVRPRDARKRRLRGRRRIERHRRLRSHS